MCCCRNCFTSYLVWPSVSFASLSLSAGRSTGSACNHAVKIYVRLSEHGAGSGIKHLDFRWSGTFVTRHGVKTEIVGRKDCQLGLYFARRGSVITMNFMIPLLLFFPYLAPWDWSGGSPQCCALMFDHDGMWWRDLQQGFPLMAPPARWLQSTDRFSVLCVRSVCNLNGACSQLVLPFLYPPPPHAHILPTDPFHASPFL